MAVILRFGQLPAAHVSFAYSPGQEALHSLHVLEDSRHHPLHIPWVLRTRKRMSPGLKAELDVFRFLFKGPGLPVLWLHNAAAVPSFEEDMATLRRQPPESFLLPLLGLALDLRGSLKDPHPGAEAFFDWAKAAHRHPDSADLFAQAREDGGARALGRFASLLEGYWESCLSHDWPAIEEMFAGDMERRGRLLMRRGLSGALDGLSPDLTVDRATETCVVRRPMSVEVTLTEQDHLHLIPSYFAWPHLYLNPVQPDLLMAYPVVEQQREGRAPVPPERLLKLLRAAGDMTRLQILQLVGTRPRSTGELAGLIGITEASVSRHLKQLQEAGLVTAERQSYYVFYRAVRAPVGELASGLEALLSGEQEE